MSGSNSTTSPQQWKPIRPLTEAEKARFYAKIDRSIPDGCHPWTGMLNDAGYGIFCIDRRRFRASRVSWFLSHGVDPGPLLIRHSCDFKPCLREDHLIEGTKKASKLTDKDVVEIRERYAAGETCPQIAAMFGVSYQLIPGILKGTRWSHVGGPLQGKLPRGPRRKT